LDEISKIYPQLNLSLASATLSKINVTVNPARFARPVVGDEVWVETAMSRYRVNGLPRLCGLSKTSGMGMQRVGDLLIACALVALTLRLQSECPADIIGMRSCAA
jgi:hypothetical protein